MFGERTADYTRELKWTLVFTLAALAFGVWGLWDQLVEETLRLDAWQGLLVWLGDLMAVGWFAYVFLIVFVRGVSAQDIAARGKPTGRLALVSMVVGLGIDIGATLYVDAQEEAAFERAVPAKGFLVAYEDVGTRHAPRVDLTYRFRDPAGREHQSRLTIEPRGGAETPEFLSKEQQLALAAGAFPIPIEVKFDPRQPRRNWPRDITWEETNMRWLFFLSKVTAFIQGFLLISVAMTLHENRHSPEHSRAALEEINVFAPLVPLVAESMILALFAARPFM